MIPYTRSGRHTQDRVTRSTLWERAGLVPYSSLQFANNKQPSCAVLKSDPSYLGRSVYDFPDLIVPPRELGPDGRPLDPNAPQLKDFQLTGLNWLASVGARVRMTFLQMK